MKARRRVDIKQFWHFKSRLLERNSFRRKYFLTLTAVLYIINCGFSKIELIIKAASQSSRTPLSEKDAARGMVPYIQRGDTIPRTLATAIPEIPSFLLHIARTAPWILSFTKTEITEPITIPITQYGKICLN